MDAWGKSLGAGDKVLMLADGNGQFAKALGVELDLTDKGLGLRSRRYALLADDQVSISRGGGGGSQLGRRVRWQHTVRPACMLQRSLAPPLHTV
jgi:hypothetical protein